jgi:hypothetical protein
MIRTTLIVAAFAGLLGFGVAQAQDAPAAPASTAAAASAAPATATGPIRPLQQCLNPSQITRWQALGARAAAVIAGDSYFEIRFGDDCDNDRSQPAAWQMATGNSNVLCGDSGESAITASGNICPIAAMRRLDPGSYAALIAAKSG